uniref:Mechanosensitive ion channel protein MscS n=5 Tax=unclassified Prevotella TaxID=2638335 RepID=A0AB33JQC9_9BACT
MSQDNKEQATEEQIAVRPKHRMERIDTRDSLFKLRNILNICFMVLAIAGVCMYVFTMQKSIAITIMIAGVVIKFIEVALRMFHK